MPLSFFFKLCQVCINCGSWANPRVETAVCSHCQFDNEKFAEFFLFCDSLGKGLNIIENDYLKNKINPREYQERLYAARTHELNYGWLPDVLAILSIITLGVLTNSSDDAIKRWVLSKKEGYKQLYIEPFKYETSVEILFDYISANHDKVISFRMSNDHINGDFERHLHGIKNQIQPPSNMET